MRLDDLITATAGSPSLSPNPSMLALVMVAHSVAAIWAMAVPKRQWLWSLRVSNPLIALLSVALVLALYTPWFNPLQ